VAEKLGLPQITYAEVIQEIEDGRVVVRRALPLGTETVRCTLPCLLSVVGSANQPRPPSARRMIAYKLAATPFEYGDLLKAWPEFGSEDALRRYLSERDLQIPAWSAADVGAEEVRVGLSGSPTKVLKVDFVVLESAESKSFAADEAGMAELVQELVQEYVL
jgi:electron transfer flavoprotein beta subunit